MNHKAFDAIVKLDLIHQGDRVCAALSGGADSVALTHFLWKNREQLGITLTACHLNHCLREEESFRDQRFVEDFCRERSIPLTLRTVDIAALARKNGLSVEECGREERYRLFEELCAGEHSLVATAHTQSDNVETVVFHLCRGTGLKGLTGIPPKRGKIIRPLILATREEVEGYCQREGLPYVTDSSNLQDVYSRNRVRHRVLPELEAVHPGAKEAIARLSRTLALEEDFLEEEGRRCLDSIRLGEDCSRPGFLALHPAMQGRVLALLLKERGLEVTAQRLTQLMGRAEAGEGQVSLPGGWIFAASPTTLAFLEESAQQSGESIPLPREGLPDFSIQSASGKQLSFWELQDCEQIKNFIQKKDSRLKNILDYDKIYNTVLIRHRLPWYAIQLVGRGCQKSLKKLFNEEKIPPWKRPGLWVLADPEGPIWVEGFGAAQRVAATGETRQGLEIKEGEDNE